MESLGLELGSVAFECLWAMSMVRTEGTRSYHQEARHFQHTVLVDMELCMLIVPLVYGPGIDKKEVMQ